MNPQRQRFFVMWVGGSASLCGLLIAGSTVCAHRSITPLPDYGVLPAFSLLDHERRPVTREALLGSVWIADFIFTRCAGQCPLMSTTMAKLAHAHTGDRRLRLVSLSVDPAYDTPERLAAYAERYGAHEEQWRFVTGEAQAMEGLAREGFHLGVGSDGGSAREPITHSVRLILVDQQAHVRGYYDATDAQAITRLSNDVRALLRKDRS